MQNKSFKIVFCIILLCLGWCVIRLARIECGYELLNFLEERNILHLSPRQVARQYILALKRKDYRIAYSYLTPDSQELVRLADFVAENEKHMSDMDADKTWIIREDVIVGMQIYKRPGKWGYVLVKTNGKWKIVMDEGLPSFPFACCYKQW